jgi:hypothetical protein
LDWNNLEEGATAFSREARERTWKLVADFSERSTDRKHDRFRSAWTMTLLLQMDIAIIQGRKGDGRNGSIPKCDTTIIERVVEKKSRVIISVALMKSFFCATGALTKHKT